MKEILLTASKYGRKIEEYEKEREGERNERNNRFHEGYR